MDMADPPHHPTNMFTHLINPPPHPGQTPFYPLPPRTPHSPTPSPPPPHLIANITTTSSWASSRRPSNGKHPIYRGIRSRNGKWVSEIREPLKTNRIWLGTHPTPEMAAAAYDVAALALKGSEAALNFPEYVSYFPVPTSPSATDIQRAAASAAAWMKLESGAEAAAGQLTNDQPVHELSGNNGQDFVDEEALFDMPNLLLEMAKGMLVSPPRMTSPPTLSDSTGNSDTESLWTY